MKTYANCPKKRAARQVTLTDAWRNSTGLRSIPVGSQYWTLCGLLADAHGDLSEGCELAQLVGSGLITPDQFHGVEKEAPIHAANLHAVRGMRPTPHLYLGMIHTEFERALAEGRFRPSFVNLDTIYEPERAVRLFGHTLHLLNHAPGVKVLVLNTIVDAPRRGRRYDLEVVLHEINRSKFCKRQLDRGGWVQSTDGWVYGGTGKTSFKMGTLVFQQPYTQAAVG